MKLNEKIALIKEQLTEEIKPLDLKDILRSAHIEPKIEQTNNYQFVYKFRTAFILLFALLILIPFILKPKSTVEEETTPIYGSIDEIYGFIATSAVALVYSSSDIFTMNNIDIYKQDLLVYEELSNLNRFLSPIEMMLSHNRNYFYAQPSDNHLYAKKIIYQGIGLLGEELYYKIYYNEQLISSTCFQIDCIVVLESKTIKLQGQKYIADNNTILQMTYYVNDDNHKDYIQVSKNLSDSSDSYDYLAVKDDIIINKIKLTLIKGQEISAKLENILLKEQTTIFTIYLSQANKFTVDYSITPLQTNSGYDNSCGAIEESGNIIIEIDENTSSFYLCSNNVHDTILFTKPNP